MSDLKFDYFSTKTYTHSLGLSCCFRQWPAIHSHCRFIHGYAMQVTLVFKSQQLDARNWVVDFGGLKEVKQMLSDTFDHKMLVARNDPQAGMFQALDGVLAQVNWVDAVGCEAFAELIFKLVHEHTFSRYHNSAYLYEVKVSEHEGNSAMCRLSPEAEKQVQEKLAATIK